MEEERQPDHCDICGVVIGDDSAICAECERAFEPASPEEVTRYEPLLDLEHYCCQMFPWEQSKSAPVGNLQQDMVDTGHRVGRDRSPTRVC